MLETTHTSFEGSASPDLRGPPTQSEQERGIGTNVDCVPPAGDPTLLARPSWEGPTSPDPCGELRLVRPSRSTYIE